MIRKAKNQIPNMEDLIEGQRYAVTINPIDKFQYFAAQQRVNNCAVALDTILFYNNAKYKLYPELSSKGRFHLHGYITVMNKIEFYLFSVPYMLSRCTIVIKELKDEDKWDEYIHKQNDFHNYVQNQCLIEVPIDIH